MHEFTEFSFPSPDKLHRPSPKKKICRWISSTLIISDEIVKSCYNLEIRKCKSEFFLMKFKNLQQI